MSHLVFLWRATLQQARDRLFQDHLIPKLHAFRSSLGAFPGIRITLRTEDIPPVKNRRNITSIRGISFISQNINVMRKPLLCLTSLYYPKRRLLFGFAPDGSPRFHDNCQCRPDANIRLKTRKRSFHHCAQPYDFLWFSHSRAGTIRGV